MSTKQTDKLYIKYKEKNDGYTKRIDSLISRLLKCVEVWLCLTDGAYDSYSTRYNEIGL